MRAVIIASSLLLVSSVAWAKPVAKPVAKCTGLSCAVAKKAVVNYLGQLPGGWSVTLSKYTENIKQKQPGVLVVGGYKKVQPNTYLWQAISNRRVDVDYEDPHGQKLFRVFEGKVIKRKSGKVEAWRFPTFEEWQQTGGGF
jgi:hypothetical protein